MLQLSFNDYMYGVKDAVFFSGWSLGSHPAIRHNDATRRNLQDVFLYLLKYQPLTVRDISLVSVKLVNMNNC